MKRSFFLIIVFSALFLASQVSFAQQGSYLQLSFSDLGWKESVRLEGGNPAYTLYLPNFTGVDWGQSFLYLHLDASQFIHSPSSVSVYGDGELLLHGRLRAGENTLRIALGALSREEKVHRIEIRAYLVVSEDFCEDLASGNLFLVLRKDSLFQLYREEVPLESLEDFLSFPTERIEILLPPGEWSPDIQEAFMRLYVFLKRFYRDMPVQIALGVLEDKTAEPGEHLRIFLSEERYRDFEIYGKALYLTPRGVEAVTQLPEFFIFTSSEIEKVSEPTAHPGQKITFKELGVNSLSFRGMGEMKYTVYFAASDLGGLPRSLNLVLYRNYLPSRYEANFLVKLNGELIYSEKLDTQGAKELSPLVLQLPALLLSRENSLELCFSYFPEVGHCRRSEAPFEGFISGESYLEVKELAPLPDLLTFGDLPTFFGGKASVVLPDKASPESLMIAARIVAALRSMDRVPVEIKVLRYSELQNKLDSARNLSSWRKPFFRFFYLPWSIREYNHHLKLRAVPAPKRVALLLAFAWENLLYTLRDLVLLPLLPFLEKGVSSQEFLVFIEPPDTFLNTLSSPLLVEGGKLVVRAGLGEESLLRASPDQPLAILSVFREGAFPAIAFISYGRQEVARHHFLENFKGVETLRRLSGNVALFGKEGLSSLLTVKVSPSRGEILPRWKETLIRFRLVILLVGISLIIVLAGFLYHRLTHPPF